MDKPKKRVSKKYNNGIGDQIKEKIVLAYRTGLLSNFQIAEKYGVSHTTVNKMVKNLNLTTDLKTEVSEVIEANTALHRELDDSRAIASVNKLIKEVSNNTHLAHKASRYVLKRSLDKLTAIENDKDISFQELNTMQMQIAKFKETTVGKDPSVILKNEINDKNINVSLEFVE